jgi:hypothetical protein
VNVSKENAAEAAACLARMVEWANGHDCTLARRDVDWVRAFLEAARRKLPSEAALARAKEGRKK